MRHAFCFVFLVGVACAEGEGPEPVHRPGPPGKPQPLPPPDLVIRAAGVQALSFTPTTFALPTDFAGADALYFAVQDDGRIIVGGDAGLFAVGATATSSISAIRVRGVFESASVGFLVATDEGVYVYDGTLIPSQLDEAIGGERVGHFTGRGDELWFASEQRLYLFDGTELFAFDEMTGVSGLSTYADGDIAVATASSGFALLRPMGTNWQRFEFPSQLSLSTLAPASGGRLFGVTNGELVERIERERDGEVVWRPVSLVDDETDPGAIGVQRLVVDPRGGALWVLQSDRASRVDGDRVGTVALPAALGTIVSARVTMDGALWISDGAGLVRIGSDEPPLSFALQVEPFNEKNCARCHAPMLGISTLVLDSVEDWRDNIDTIIEQVEARTMPLDAMPLLGGDVDLPRRWLSGGMQP